MILLATSAAALVAVIVSGILWQRSCAAHDHQVCPMPGSFSETDGCRLHLRCSGQGAPAVVLEAGIAGSSVGWAYVQPQLAEFTRVCSYDRPGLAWSPPSGKRSPDQFVRDLRTVVQPMGAPVILVGHSFGALIVRLYAARYPEEVAGLVLVDSALLGEWAEPTQDRLSMLRHGVALSRRGAVLARIGFVRFVLKLLTGGSRLLPRYLARVSSGGQGAPVMQRLAGEVMKLPPELWPVVQSHWCRPESFQSMAEHLEVLPAVAAAVARSPLPPTIRVIAISGAHLEPEAFEEHRALGEQVIAEGSAHWVHLDRPDLIVSAVRSLLTYG